MLDLIFSAVLSNSINTAMCQELAEFSKPGVEISSAELVPAGVFEGASGPGNNTNNEPLPEHCRLKMVLDPSGNSEINVELWLPAQQWNGKFLAVGNGGWAGSIQGYPDMQAALQRGYATAANDTGHTGGSYDGTWTIGQPEKIVDFAYRAMHEMTITAKQLITTAYGRSADLSYYKGCSTGGRQGLMSAWRYPQDFDAIIAGAPANRHLHMHVAQSSEVIYLNRHPELELSPAMAEQINSALMSKCDVLQEGFLNNPHQCNFDFAVFACEAGDNPDTCLDRQQLNLVESYYSGVRDSNGELIFSGNALGNPVPAFKATGEAPFSLLFDTIRMAHQDADYPWQEFSMEDDLQKARDIAGFIEVLDPDLSEFRDHGGKLILYHGWQDTGISPKNSIRYYTDILHEMGPRQDDWVALFMIPGMGHCSGGPGPWDFDTLTTLEQWREEQVEPARMMGRNPDSGLERPLCAFPAAAKYDGTGDLAAADNWQCYAPASSQ